MNEHELTIPNISCGHCVMTIKNELSELEGIVKVDGDADAKSILVQFEDSLTLEKIKSVLDEINYPAE